MNLAKWLKETEAEEAIRREVDECEWDRWSKIKKKLVLVATPFDPLKRCGRCYMTPAYTPPDYPCTHGL